MNGFQGIAAINDLDETCLIRSSANKAVPNGMKQACSHIWPSSPSSFYPSLHDFWSCNQTHDGHPLMAFAKNGRHHRSTAIQISLTPSLLWAVEIQTSVKSSPLLLHALIFWSWQSLLLTILLCLIVRVLNSVLGTKMLLGSTNVISFHFNKSLT